MEKTKQVVKSGWHQQHDKGLRGHVSGLVGRGQKSQSTEPDERVARPLASLKDPAAFGPPPKNVNYHGGAALPNTTTPDRRGLGAPLSTEELSSSHVDLEREEVARKPAPPPIPYRADRTGLNTSGLRSPPKPTAIGANAPATRPKPKPKLPPRLPPRQNSQPLASASSPPPPYTENAPCPARSSSFHNQGTANRLAQSGISVPGFGIRPPPAPKAVASPPIQDQNPENPWRDQSSPSSPSIGGLQGRFSSLSTSASPPPSAGTAGSGTTFAQKQAALSTASQLQRDPSKVSIADAREAVGTANNFHERHGEEAAKGWKVGQGLNKKYGIAGKIQNYAGNASQSTAGGNATSSVVNQEEHANPWAEQLSPSGMRKAPPPPVPFSSKPK